MRNKEGSGAPKGASIHVRATLADVTVRQCAGAEARQTGARSPSGASPRHSPNGRDPLTQLQTTFPGTGQKQAFCPPHACPVQRAPRRPVLVPAEWCPEAARVRIGNSARGHRSRSALQACLPERRPSIERDSQGCNGTGDICQWQCDAEKWPWPSPRKNRRRRPGWRTAAGVISSP